MNYRSWKRRNIDTYRGNHGLNQGNTWGVEKVDISQCMQGQRFIRCFRPGNLTDDGWIELDSPHVIGVLKSPDIHADAILIE